MDIKNIDFAKTGFDTHEYEDRCFIACNFSQVDFVEADLSGSTFDNCDLNGTIFERTNLEKVDFRTAGNYSFDPDLNRVKKARFSIPDVVGLLRKYDIRIG